MLCALLAFTLGAQKGEIKNLIEPMHAYTKGIIKSLEDLSQERKIVLQPAVDWIWDRLKSGQAANLTFICTANSRRSHLGQVWAQIAATYYELPKVTTYSGGIQVTACNPRTIATFKRAGLEVVGDGNGENPLYTIKFSEKCEAIRAYSKLYDATENPQSDFAAMMCCADADEKCPVVKGCVVRVPLHYKDPKSADGTPEEVATYDARSKQIATEMFYLMSQVKQKLSKPEPEELHACSRPASVCSIDLVTRRR